MLGGKKSKRRDGAPTSEGDVKTEDEEVPPGSNHRGGNPESLADSSNGCAFTITSLLSFVLLRVCTFGPRIDNYTRNEQADSFSTFVALL